MDFKNKKYNPQSSFISLINDISNAGFKILFDVKGKWAEMNK